MYEKRTIQAFEAERGKVIFMRNSQCNQSEKHWIFISGNENELFTSLSYIFDARTQNDGIAFVAEVVKR